MRRIRLRVNKLDPEQIKYFKSSRVFWSAHGTVSTYYSFAEPEASIASIFKAAPKPELIFWFVRAESRSRFFFFFFF